MANTATVLETIGDRVRYAREMRGLGVNELDRRVGTRIGYISRVESGEIVDLGSRRLARIGEELEVHLDWLVRGIGPIGVRAAS